MQGKLACTSVLCYFTETEYSIRNSSTGRIFSTADLEIFSLGRKISASQSLPRNVFASENIPAGKSILAEYSGCYTGIAAANITLLAALIFRSCL